jgi:hypothetical protein
MAKEPKKAYALLVLAFPLGQTPIVSPAAPDFESAGRLGLARSSLSPASRPPLWRADGWGVPQTLQMNRRARGGGAGGLGLNTLRTQWEGIKKNFNSGRDSTGLSFPTRQRL